MGGFENVLLTTLVQEMSKNFFQQTNHVFHINMINIGHYDVFQNVHTDIPTADLIDFMPRYYFSR